MLDDQSRPWSSAAAHVKGKGDELMCLDERLDIAEWKDFLSEGISEEDAGKIQSSERTGRPLGDESFIKKLEKMTGRLLRKKKPGPKPKLAK